MPPSRLPLSLALQPFGVGRYGGGAHDGAFVREISRGRIAYWEHESSVGLISQIRDHGGIRRRCLAQPTSCSSVSSALIVEPPKGMEVGYVPIVTRQGWAVPKGSKSNS